LPRVHGDAGVAGADVDVGVGLAADGVGVGAGVAAGDVGVPEGLGVRVGLADRDGELLGRAVGVGEVTRAAGAGREVFWSAGAVL
jgi:hypothetical protein